MSLKLYLDNFLESFPKEKHIKMDPVQFVHLFSDRADREVVGFVAAALSYGNVKSVLRNVEIILSHIGDNPFQYITSFDPKRDGAILNGFRHRWSTGKDVAVLFWILGRIIERYGSIQEAICSKFTLKDASVASALDKFAAEALTIGYEQFYSPQELKARRGVRYFFPKVSEGSACKRLNLYMRWMVRPYDGVDCGVWDRIAPSSLIIPLDTHISRISQYIGLTDMRNPSWKMAEDITSSLRKLCAPDPLRYDFALCHLGIAGDCPRRQDYSKCRRCPIQPICKL